ncbi:MAG: hypothetical protein AB1306_06815 [Nitrospirota bacterium]
MKKSILEVYALAVCFATIVCFVIALGVTVYALVCIVNPEFTLSSYEYNRHQSNDAFWDSYKDKYENKDKELQRPSEEDLTKQRTASYPQAIKSERRDGTQSLTIASIILVIDVVVFLIHWLIARRAREANIVT